MKFSRNYYSEIVFDIETIPDQELKEVLYPKPKLGNIKDEKKKQAAISNYYESGKLSKDLSLDPCTNQIVTIQIYDLTSMEFVNLDHSSEKSLISGFWDYLFDKDIRLIGANIIGFDLPTLFFRSLINNELPSVKSSVVLKKYSINPVFDIMAVLSSWDKSKTKSVDWVCKRLDIDTPKNGLDGSMVYDAYKAGEINKIKEYCKKDVLATYKIYDKVKNIYF